MEMINRLTADALDSAEFVKRMKQLEHDDAVTIENLREGHGGENLQQRRARERAERNAAARAAKSRP